MIALNVDNIKWPLSVGTNKNGDIPTKILWTCYNSVYHYSPDGDM